MTLSGWRRITRSSHEACTLQRVFYGAATSGGNQGLFKRAPTREQADKLLEERLNGPFTGDANDYLYQWVSSRDYKPSPGLHRIRATLLAINSSDDERNPPELGVLDNEVKRIKNGRVMMIPASPDTFGQLHDIFRQILEAGLGGTAAVRATPGQVRRRFGIPARLDRQPCPSSAQQTGTGAA